MREPASITKGSIMPGYPHLINSELNMSTLPARVRAAAYLGAPYSEQELSDSIAVAEEQAREIAWQLIQQGGPAEISTASTKIPIEKTKIIALIAYLQRLGVDLHKSPEEDSSPTSQLSAAEQELFAKYETMLTRETLAAADVTRGREIFRETCGDCHKLFDEGGDVGPDLTGLQRSNLDFLIQNSVAPSLEILESYKTEIVVTVDGEMFTGTLAGEDETKLILKTAEKPRLEILKEDIDERKQSSVSVMPAGQLDQLEPQQVKDLMKYLQLPLPPK